jgi:hypothetical protein
MLPLQNYQKYFDSIHVLHKKAVTAFIHKHTRIKCNNTYHNTLLSVKKIMAMINCVPVE